MSKDPQEKLDLAKEHTEDIHDVENVTMFEVQITGVKPMESPSNSPRYKLSPTNIQYQPQVLINEGEAIEESTERSTSFTFTRQSDWETSGRSFIPQFTSYQHSVSERDHLIKEGNPGRESDASGQSNVVRSINNCFNSCIRFKPALMMVCGIAAFVIGGFVCKEISNLSYDTRIKDSQSKHTHYVMYGVAALLMFAAGIGLTHPLIISSYRSCRGFIRRESTVYQEI